jgi:hypothetical protein
VKSALILRVTDRNFRASRVTPAVTAAQTALSDAMTARDRECKGGVGKYCREREQAVVDRRQALDAAMQAVAQTADPQAVAAVKLVGHRAWPWAKYSSANFLAAVCSLVNFSRMKLAAESSVSLPQLPESPGRSQKAGPCPSSKLIHTHIYPKPFHFPTSSIKKRAFSMSYCDGSLQNKIAVRSQQFPLGDGKL